MRKFKIKYDWILFALLMVFLFVPIIQEWTGIFPVKPMKGVFVPTPKPEFSFETYKTNAYQTQIDKYTSENFGLRETVIKLYNQYLWDFFHKTHVSRWPRCYQKRRTAYCCSNKSLKATARTFLFALCPPRT